MVEVDYLADERRTAKFNVDAMKIVWAGSREDFEVAHKISRLVAADPAFQKDNRASLTHKELFNNTLKKASYAWKLISDLHLSEKEASRLRFFIDEPNYMDLHWGMFIPSIKGQGTEDQKKKWLPLAYKMKIIGCYAQTELGHGSNVQGLETTATFDPKTDEFIIHSPTQTSSKFWPGGLGKVSTHAVVYARLITDGHDHGINGFIVQIRSLDDHLPLPGVTVGDIGLKFGNGAYNTMDNGVLRFDNVRIPRCQMLMRVLTVTSAGKCIPSHVPRQLLYSTMVYVRQTIVSDSSVALSRAVCIATRYSAVRRQFGSQDGFETKVIDYKTQQHRLFPLLASAYALRFVGEWLKWLCTDVTEKLEANDFSTLPEVHACTSGLKALATSTTVAAIEECRKLCGGHGYLCSSGLPELYAVIVPSCTYEGDNIVLYLQVARFLMKLVGSGKTAVGTTAYVNDAARLMTWKCTVEKAEDWMDPRTVMDVFQARALRMAVARARVLSDWDNPEEGFMETAFEMVEAAVAHCQLIVVSKFIEKISGGGGGGGELDVLESLCFVYALSVMHEHRGDFLATRCVSHRQAELVADQVRYLYAAVRPSAVALVDAFDYTDHFLGSTLGRYDGDVYHHLLEHSWKSPLNDSVIPDGYLEHLRPLLHPQQHHRRTAKL